MAGLTDPIEPHVELDLLNTPWLITDYNAGLLSLAQAEAARLRRNLALTTFLLESAADEALSLLALSERCVCGAMSGCPVDDECGY